MQNLNAQTIQLAILAVVAVAVLLQAIVLLAIFLAVRKAAQSTREQVEDLISSISPILSNTRELLVHVAPKIEDTIEDLAGVAHSLRTQTSDVQATATEVLTRLRRQSSRLDGMMSTVLDAVDHACVYVSDTVTRPMRQLSGVLASVKAVLESLRAAVPAPSAPPPHAEGDKDMFV